MSIEQIVCVSIGVIVQALTFAIGVLVGVSMWRTESHGKASAGAACSNASRRGTVSGIP